MSSSICLESANEGCGGIPGSFVPVTIRGDKDAREGDNGRRIQEQKDCFPAGLEYLFCML